MTTLLSCSAKRRRQLDMQILQLELLSSLIAMTNSLVLLSIGTGSWSPSTGSCTSTCSDNQAALLLSIVNHQLVQYFGLYRTRSAHSRTICCSLCVFFFKYRSCTGIINNMHTVHALSATYRKDRFTGGGVWPGAFYPGAIDRGGKKQGASDRGGAIDRGAIDLDSLAA